MKATSSITSVYWNNATGKQEETSAKTYMHEPRPRVGSISQVLQSSDVTCGIWQGTLTYGMRLQPILARTNVECVYPPRNVVLSNAELSKDSMHGHRICASGK
uniref:Uncharacterized protein n=1 Tax=Solanum lycopersicum TaxID=4081 RepID=K4CT19_SOLLC